MLWLRVIWDTLFGWAGIDALIGFAAVAVAVLVPPIVVAVIPDLRKWAICVAVVAFTLIGAIAHGVKIGVTATKAEWDASLAKETANGEQARADAESVIRSQSPDGMRNDPRNRDNWGKQPDGRKSRSVRWVESHRFFGK